MVSDTAIGDPVISDELSAPEVPSVSRGDSLVVCGSGALALRLASEIRFAGKPVVVVCDGPSELEREHFAKIQADLVEGSPLDQSVLRRAGVTTARSLAAVGDDDVGNLRIGFAAQKVNPTIRVVLRLFSKDMGEHIESLFHDCVIIPASAVAAPSFVAAALGFPERSRIAAAGRALQVGRYEGEGAGSSGSQGVRGTTVFGRVAGTPDPRRIAAVLSRPSADGSETLFPEDVKEGDLVLRDLGWSDELDPLIMSRFRDLRHTKLGTRLQETAATVRAFFDRRFKILFAVLAAMVSMTVLVFAHFKHLSIVSSLYFTVVTLSTVGYGDYNLMNDRPWLKLYGVGFILVGATVIAVFYSFLIDTLVGVRLARALGTIHTKVKDHVIVCGLGNTGYRVAELLHKAGSPVVVIDRDENNRHLPAVRALGIPIVLGDASLVETLRTAQVESATCLVACTDDDIIGLEAAVNARSVNPELRLVLRLYDDEISKRVDYSLSIRYSRSMASLAAPVFASQMLNAAVIQSVSVGRAVRTTLVIGQVEIEPGSILDTATVASAEASGKLRILTISRIGEDPRWRPLDSLLQIQARDRVLVVAEREEWRRLVA